VVAGDAQGCTAALLDPAVGALDGGFGRENCDLFLVVGDFRSCVVEEPLDGEVFEKPRIPRAHALEDFFAAFLIADY
jgi:hypothetical protein